MRTADKPDKGACRRSFIRELSLQYEYNIYIERQGRGMSVKGNAIEALNKDRALRNPIIDWSKVSQLAPHKRKANWKVSVQEIPSIEQLMD